MQVIKTPTGMIPVDEPAQCMTQTEYNNLPADKQKSGTYYIIVVMVNIYLLLLKMVFH